MINYGQKHINDNKKLDYFAISLPDLLIREEDLKIPNQIHCEYLIGLGEMGFSNNEEAMTAFSKVLGHDL